MSLRTLGARAQAGARSRYLDLHSQRQSPTPLLRCPALPCPESVAVFVCDGPWRIMMLPQKQGIEGGRSCIAMFSVANNSWAAQQATCVSLGGNMLTSAQAKWGQGGVLDEAVSRWPTTVFNIGLLRCVRAVWWYSSWHWAQHVAWLDSHTHAPTSRP